MNSDFPKEAYKSAADYCVKDEHCKKQVVNFLIKRKISASDIELICDQLEKEGFIDNLRFAKLYAISKLNQNNWGKIKIRYMLKQLHITNCDISDALNSISDEKYEEILIKILQQTLKQRSCKSIKDQQKITLYAVSKGFEIDFVIKTLKQIIQ